MPIGPWPPGKIPPPHTDDFGFKNSTAVWTADQVRIAGAGDQCQTGEVLFASVPPGREEHGVPGNDCQATGVDCQGTLNGGPGAPLAMNLVWQAPPGTWVCYAIFEIREGPGQEVEFYGEFGLSNGEVHYDIPLQNL